MNAYQLYIKYKYHQHFIKDEYIYHYFKIYYYIYHLFLELIIFMFIISAYYLSILIIFTFQNFGGVHLNDTDFQMDSQELYLKFHIFCKVQLFFEYLIF